MVNKSSEVKKEIKASCDELIEAVKLISVYEKALSKNNRITISFKNEEDVTETHEISRADINSLTSQIVFRLRKLPQDITELNKKKVSDDKDNSAGLKVPYKYNDEFINFFTNSTFGNMIEGELVKKGKIKEGKDMIDSGELINDYLYFTKEEIDDKPNPLYGITINSVLTTLITNHSYHNDMVGDHGNLKLSKDMRKMLKNTVTATIKNGIKEIVDSNPELLNEGKKLEKELIESISDENKYVENSTLNGEAIFNPNRFIHPHISKLTTNGKETGVKAKLDEDKIKNVFNMSSNDLFQKEQELASLSNRWKKEILNKENRRLAALERQSKREMN